MAPLSSLENIPHQTTTSAKMSLSERKAVASKFPWILPQLTETDELMQPITRRPPGDNSRPEAMTIGRAELARQKSNYYDVAFSVHGSGNPRRERMLGDSMVVVELKTNVIVSPVSAVPEYLLLHLAFLGWPLTSQPDRRRIRLHNGTLSKARRAIPTAAIFRRGTRAALGLYILRRDVRASLHCHCLGTGAIRPARDEPAQRLPAVRTPRGSPGCAVIEGAHPLHRVA